MAGVEEIELDDEDEEILDRIWDSFSLNEKGSAQSGNWSHVGRPGLVGGSGAGGGGEPTQELNRHKFQDMLAAVSHGLGNPISFNEQYGTPVMANGDETPIAMKKHVMRAVTENTKIPREDTEKFLGFLSENYGYDFQTEQGFQKYNVPDGPSFVNAFFVTRWAETSGDSDSMAIAMQLRVREKFGVEDVGKISGHTPEQKTPEVYGRARKILEEHGKVIDGFIDAVYQQTQASLKAAGIDKITLYRGMRDDTGLDLQGNPQKLAGEVHLQPASSFTSSFDTAAQFAIMPASYGGKGRDQIVIAIDVPREKILSTPATGMGCFAEMEAVVLGGRYPARIIAAGPNSSLEGSADFWRNEE